MVIEATVVVDASPDEILDFVMDLERYRRADTKIRKVLAVWRDGDDVIATMATRSRGVPAKATQRMHMTPGVRIDVTNEPSWQDKLVEFHGEFVCAPVNEGTSVTHRYTFAFKGPGRMAELYYRRWMQRDIEDEVGRLKDILEAD